MKKIILAIILLNEFSGFAQLINTRYSDSVLTSLGLSPKDFTIQTYQQARKKYYDSKPYDFSLKSNDTIILARIDTFLTKVILNNKSIPFKFDMSEKVFMDGLDLRSSNFKNQVYFVNSDFYNTLNASLAIFDSTIIFSKVKIRKPAIFFDTRFNNLEMIYCGFYGITEFTGAKFAGPASFSCDTFKVSTNFISATFYSKSSFFCSTFISRPLFWETDFLDTVLFDFVKFEDGVDFQSSKMHNFLSLDNVIAKEKIQLNNTTIPEYTDLSSLNTIFPLDFNFISDIGNKNKFKINIYNTDLSKLLITFKFSLWFDKYLNIDQKNVVYKELLEHLNKFGYKQVYKAFDLEYRNFLNTNYNNFWARIAFTFNRLWWNYGYSKQRIFFIALILISAFSTWIYFNLNYYLNTVYKIESLSTRMKGNKQITNKIKQHFFDYLIALLFTTYIFFNLKLTMENLSFKSYRAGLFILTIYVSGLICTAFIINLILSI